MFRTYISFIISLLQTAIQIIISAKFTWLINVYVIFFKVDLNNYKIQEKMCLNLEKMSHNGGTDHSQK